MGKVNHTIKPYKHQQEIIDLNPKYCGLFFEPGGGKTLTAIRLAENNATKILVICPKSLVQQWSDELEKFKTKESIEFTIISKEQFKKKYLSLTDHNGLIVDEAHMMFCSYKAQGHKNLISYINANRPNCIYLLTGTPYTSTCWSVFCLGKILGRDWKWYAWNKQYFQQIRMGHRTIPVQRSGIENEIAKIVERLGYVKKLSDLIDIPDQIYQNEYFDINRKQTKTIDELIDVQPIVRFTKIHQIENGQLKGDGYSNDKIIECDKTKRIIELCTQYKKIAIIARYNLQLATYKKLINKKVFIINGATKNKNDVVSEINETDECVVLINASCSVGYNLWSVPIMVFASMGFSYVDYKQMCARLLRINHPKKNLYIHLLTAGKSIDSAVYKCMEQKKDFDIAIYEK